MIAFYLVIFFFVWCKFFCSSVMQLKIHPRIIMELKHNVHNYQTVMFLHKCYAVNSYQKLHIAALITIFVFCTV